MLSLHSQTRIYLALAPSDLRKSFRGLLVLTEGVLRKNPLSGHLFVFLNRRRDMLKALYWDSTGYCIWHKRLERGRFQMPSVPSNLEVSLELSSTQLSLILEGIDLSSVKQRLRYRAPRATTEVPS